MLQIKLKKLLICKKNIMYYNNLNKMEPVVKESEGSETSKNVYVEFYSTVRPTKQNDNERRVKPNHPSVWFG